MERFNPHAREERDLLHTDRLERQPCFNPRAREERDRWHIPPDAIPSRFNPRAREERDAIAYNLPFSQYKFAVCIGVLKSTASLVSPCSSTRVIDSDSLDDFNTARNLRFVNRHDIIGKIPGRQISAFFYALDLYRIEKGMRRRVAH